MNDMLSIGVAVLERSLALDAINKALEPVGIRIKSGYGINPAVATYVYYADARHADADASIPQRFNADADGYFRTFYDAVDYALYRIIEHYRGGA